MTNIAASQPAALTTAVSDSSVSRDTLPGEVIVVPVVIHVLYNSKDQNISDAQVLSQINVLNEDYRRLNADAVNTPAPFRGVAADARITFRLARVDPNGYATSGIIHKYTSQSLFLSDDGMKFSSSGGDDAWDARRYLNIWVCSLFGRTLGYATMPGGPAERDGVVIQFSAFGTTGTATPPYNLGRTTTHEIGHWLGLRHPWGDAVCGDDSIADTPPQEGATSGCPTFPQLSSCSINSYGNMFMDFMDFTDDACMNMFTRGQVTEMRGLFALGHIRNTILVSKAYDSTLAMKDTVVTDPGGPSTAVTLRVYPNPFGDHFTLHSADGKGLAGLKATLYSASGKVILQQTLASEDATIRTGTLPAGIYILKLDGLHAPQVFKLVKSTSGN